MTDVEHRVRWLEWKMSPQCMTIGDDVIFTATDGKYHRGEELRPALLTSSGGLACWGWQPATEATSVCAAEQS